jgi:selenocysteine lyase/cysteine desulfurase
VTAALVPKADFRDLERVTHLYTAAECPMLVRAAEAMSDYTRQKSRAEAGRANHAVVTAATKQSLAELLGVAASEIALLGSASEAINAVADVLDLRAGDNVVVNDLEFPSVVLPWLRRRERGLEVRVVRHREWEIPTGALLGAVDDRTKLVALSHVSYVNGLRHDVEAIGAALRDTRTRFLLDATQSLGILSVPATAADFVVSSTYKWQLGTHGLGVLYVNPARLADLAPQAIGWYSIDTPFTPDRYERYTLRAGAGRFETGYLSFPAVYALGASIPYLLAAGVARIERHAQTLGDRLIEGLTALGLPVITPIDHARRGASVSFLHERAAEIGPALANRNVHVWAGDGRVRASTHLFNDGDDVECYLEALRAVI